MRRTDWRNTVIIISVGLVILLSNLVFTATGNSAILIGVNSILTPLVALFLGIIGLRIYARDSEAKDDRFYTLNLWLSIGLIMLSLAEVAKTLVSLSVNPQDLILIVALAQLPGLLLWGLGIIQYLRSLNSALGYVNSNNLWFVLFLSTALSTIVLIVINATQFAMISFTENIVLSPIIIGLAVFVIINMILVGIFRNGALAKPLFLILGALILYLVRCLLWLFTDTGLMSPTDGLIAIESFILCGAALVSARNL
ncbi:MAG: hypothetical protein RTU63_13220 [Candidatus Thorarchaeota archaeon]